MLIGSSCARGGKHCEALRPRGQSQDEPADAAWPCISRPDAQVRCVLSVWPMPGQLILVSLGSVYRLRKTPPADCNDLRNIEELSQAWIQVCFMFQQLIVGVVWILVSQQRSSGRHTLARFNRSRSL